MIDINDPKVRWAQHNADVSNKKYVIVANVIGGFDVKPEESVSLFYSDIVMVIEPRNHRVFERDPRILRRLKRKIKLIARLKRGINLCVSQLAHV